MTTATAPYGARSGAPYPVHVDAATEPAASRWLWLVKWLLAIPHYVVLAFLWVAFVVLSLVAFVAIVVTGRYPRAIFEFNVGVLRWSWRVAYYSYGALATDRYPPFTLDDVEDYPARLRIDYPEHLSRGLALVKWWLLALPHYVVVGVFVGSGVWWAQEANGDARWVWGSGLIGILVLVAAVVLGVTGTYPRTVYDLVLGINRWVLRVAAYAGLMTDQYPPFRLDQGPHEAGEQPPPGHLVMQTAGPTAGMTAGMAAPAAPPAVGPHTPVDTGTRATYGVPVPPGAPPPPAPGPRPPHGTGWTGGRVVSVVIGAVMALASLGLLTGGFAALVADRAMRDGGYLTAQVNDLTSDGYAAVVDGIVLEGTAGGRSWPSELLGDVRVRVTNVDPSTPVFVGIGRAAAVDQYLSGVARSTRPGRFTEPFEVTGAAPSAPPTAVQAWTVQASGTGTQQITWRPRDGRWSLAVMNADGSRPVDTQVELGATVPALPWLGVSAMVTGLVLLALATLLVVLPVREASRTRT